MHRHYFLGDMVRYVGEGRSLGKNAWGEVVGYIKNENSCVVEFQNGDYIVDETDLQPYVFSEKEKGPEVIKISKKWDDV